MSLDKLLRLQLLYCLLGVLFNVVSYWFLTQHGKALTSTEPISGLVAMSIYGLMLLPGKIRELNVYRILMVIAILIFGYGGIVNHFILYPQSPELYHSLPIAIFGMSINIFGLIWNIYAALGKYKV